MYSLECGVAGCGRVAVRDEGSVSYSAAIESPASRDTDRELSEFTQRVEREATRRRCRDAQRLVVIGEGAAWIWNLAQKLFPQAVQIVDRFHAKERFSEVTKSLYGETSGEAKRWAQRRHQELDEGAGRISSSLSSATFFTPRQLATACNMLTAQSGR